MTSDPAASEPHETPAPPPPGPEAADPAALQAEVTALKDRLLRAMADAENQRKRAERDKLEAGQYAIAKFARDMLNVADNFARALSALPQGEGVSDAVKAVLDGVAATEREMLSILERHGIRKVDPKPGDRFDPHLHQAIAEIPAPGAAGTIAQVIQPGYVIADRLLRAAMVATVRASETPPPAVDTTA